MSSNLQVHGGNVIESAERLGLNTNQILDASASLVPFKPPKSLQQCLINQVKENSFRYYPDHSYRQLKEAIGNWHSIDPSMVLPGNGAAELLTWCARDAAEMGTSTLLSPSFSDYERSLNCWNGKLIHLDLPLSWSNKTPQAFPVSTSTHVVWITNPHNPTGQLWSRKSIEQLLSRHGLVICDEAFLSLVPHGEKQSLIPLVANHPNLIVIRSLTKLFGIAGLRLGYAISSSERLQKWQNWRDPWPLNSLASTAGIILMNDHIALERWTTKIHNWIIKEGAWLQSKLQTIPEINSHYSSTNFQLIESKDSLEEVREYLFSRRILVRECSSFRGLGNNWLRISLQKRKNNKRIFSEIKKIVKQIH